MRESSKDGVNDLLRRSDLCGYAEVIEARLIEAVRVFERLERSGRAVALDGPWKLMRLDVSDRWTAELGQLENGEVVDSALLARAVLDPRPDRAMMTRAEEAVAWLARVSDRDRLLVRLAVTTLARGADHVPWLALRRPLGVELGAGGLAKRYVRALNRLAWSLGALCVDARPLSLR